MKNSTAFMFLIILFTQSSLIAEKAPMWNVVGIVLEQETETPLPYVTATLNQSADSTMLYGTITNELGMFDFKKVEQNTYFLRLSFVGYNDVIISPVPLDKENRSIDLGQIRMSPSNNLLEEVMVEAKVNPLSNSIDKQILDVDQNLVAKGGSALDAIRLSPSVQTDANDEIMLRGSKNFIVLIDGRPTPLSPNDVLRSTPANQIESIEVITNPSVKYRAEGGAGVINIIMKRNTLETLNGRINTTLGSREKYGANASINWNKQKFNISGALNWRDFTTHANHNYSKITNRSDTSFLGSLNQDRLSREKSLDLRFGLNYEPSEKTTIDYAFHGGKNAFLLDIEVESLGQSMPESTENRHKSMFDFDQKPSFLTNSLGVSRELGKKSKIDIYAYYSYIDYYLSTQQVSEKTDENFIPIDPQPYKQNVLNDNYSNDYRLNLDYTTPINNQINVESGAAAHRYVRNLDIRYSQFDYMQNSWIDNPLYTNKFDFYEDVYSAYTHVNGNLQGIQMSLGIRAEYTDRYLQQRSSENGFDYRKLNWFPAFSFSKTFLQKHSISAAMSNRINRPNEYFLNPYPEFEDDYFYSEGNPNLIPELVRNVELSYKNIGEKMVFSGNVFYRRTTNKIEQLLIEGDQGKLRTTFHNNARDQSIGGELMANITAMDWWSINANTSIYQHRIQGAVLNDEIKKTNISYTIQMVQSFQAPFNVSAQLISYYQNRSQHLQYDISSLFMTDVSFSKDFFAGRLNAGLTVKDIFRTKNYSLITEAQNTHLEADFLNESPIVLLNIGYQISQYKKKTKDVHTEFDM